jgi:single-stranded-DNA-specific exonuclease
VVPDRAVHGYGLTPAIVDLARAQRPDVLVTVDNGIASLAGVAHARALGLQVLVTDHHLPALDDGAVVLPEADVIVNPNQPGCGFASKALAGVGVMFYVLLATARRAARARRLSTPRTQPRLDALLDLVALGTVADVVKLDANNRRLVAQGLKRIRAGRMQPGVAALFAWPAATGARRGLRLRLCAGPAHQRRRPAGRHDAGHRMPAHRRPGARRRAGAQLDAINRERREVEAGMREQAEHAARALLAARRRTRRRAGAVRPRSFHEGVVGIVAGRLKDRLHRPTFVFARGADGLLKGSGRSIPGFHLRDALDLVAKRHPGAAAALRRPCDGRRLHAGRRRCFRPSTRRAAAGGRRVAGRRHAERTLRTDGPLACSGSTPRPWPLLDAQVWGQGFEAPVFCDEVQVLQQRLVGEKHLKLRVRHAGAAARRDLVRPHRAAAEACGWPTAEPGRVERPAAGADGGGGGGR